MNENLFYYGGDKMIIDNNPKEKETIAPAKKHVSIMANG